MMWYAIVVIVGALVMLIAVVARVARKSVRSPLPVDEIDPLFSIGVVFTGAGVATASTLGPVMYGVMTLGLLMMAIGANRSGHRGQRRPS